ncbi:hypothetical protein ZIOFF_037503 [Zingiber officinale]|uniref:Uncharacterized protein n=1 Tax=Zingiber officinale TaxID=94328 RepID=A0A8J5GQW3_ZINOF|nr:hypothetical protein ZIOFF_037503 [Zingiber officinale]
MVTGLVRNARKQTTSDSSVDVVLGNRSINFGRVNASPHRPLLFPLLESVYLLDRFSPTPYSAYRVRSLIGIQHWSVCRRRFSSETRHFSRFRIASLHSSRLPDRVIVENVRSSFSMLADISCSRVTLHCSWHCSSTSQWSVSGSVCASTDLSIEDSNRCSDLTLNSASLLLKVAPLVMESLYWPLAKALQSQARTLTNISCRHQNENMVAKPCDSMHRNLSQSFRSHYWRNSKIREAYNHSIDNCGLMGPWLGCDWDECLLLEHELCDLDNPQQLPETCDGLDWGHGLSCYGILCDLFDLLDVQEGKDGDLRLEVGGFDGAGRARSQRRMQVEAILSYIAYSNFFTYIVIGLALPPQNEVNLSLSSVFMTACYFGEVSAVKPPVAEAQLVSAFSTGALREDATKTLIFAGTTCFCIQHWFLLESSFALFVALLINLAVVSVSGTLCATTDLSAKDSNRCSDLT